MSHSPIGASAAHRFIPCPASRRLQAGIEDVDTVHKALGRLAHSWAEMMLTRKGMSAEDMAAYALLPQEKRSEIADCVQVYVDHVRDLASAPGAISHVEVKVGMPRLHPDLWGTADSIVWQPGTETLHVSDYKHGVSRVDAKSPQLPYYALAAVETLGYRPQRVLVHIVQPRAGGIKTVEYTLDELAEFGALIQAAAYATEKEDAPAVSGKWCRWCRAEPICPAKVAEASARAMRDFTTLVDNTATTV